MESGYLFFTESEIYDIENKEDLKFLQEFNSEGQSLIKNVRDKYRINFVGEVITPNHTYFSLPKNMISDDDVINNENALLIKNKSIKIPSDSKITPDSLSKLMLDQAAQNFAVVANSISNKDTLHQAWHNIGNCYLQKKDFQQAVDAYKKSLKYNPKDEDTRYNLAYALKNMPKDKKNGGGTKQKQQNKKEDSKNDKDKKPQPQQNKMSKEQADQLLKALMNSEKKLQDKRKQKQEDGANQNIEKDW